ncbi:nickel-dependent hydrogenase large subunit [Desulfopila inferna]|uniref:nickel-dependent hydrogenase large subunit n=1 Tax=Desulfopila inferna TaxID=468528 RepID=UPI0019633E8B|nr:nickel-dependent hydrogenase large subunit [Desulfopila inferna]MBM9605304.1 nickel-dependent hydrogenase large subunit [Desulfopila inferna]
MSKITKNVNIPLNRAEGDLEINVEVVDGVITQAWSSGTMYRGFEAMMLGRGALDGLVITPRICGICSLTHLTAAVEALDAITGVKPPDNARRLRNLALMVETIQSDVRQAILMFMVDFANREAYGNHPLGQEAVERYAPLQGSAAIEVIRETKRLIEIVGIIGGQWPHTSFMVPGGVTSMPDTSKIMQCRMILRHFQSWYERFILGCSVERWQQISTEAELDEWLEEKNSHRNSEVGFFIRFARQAGLDSTGRGPNRYLSYGNLTLPEDTTVAGTGGRLTAAGFATDLETFQFDPREITEDISHSWFEKEDEPLHPFKGKTTPYASGMGGELYSWVKAPRYRGKVIETGPLAEEIIGGNQLYRDIIQRGGPNTLIRELARLTRPAGIFSSMMVWFEELVANCNADFYHKVSGIPDGEGAGLIQAARGALGHWVRIKGDKITHYQVITPSSWNGSPRDSEGNRGAWEEALINTPIRDVKHPVEAGHVIRSFDPCLVCAVHAIRKKR